MNREGHVSGVVTLFITYMIKVWMNSPSRERTQSQGLMILLYHLLCLYGIFAGTITPDLDLAMGVDQSNLLKALFLAFIPYIGSLVINRVLGTRGSLYRVRGLGLVQNSYLLMATLLVVSFLILTWLRIRFIGFYNGYSHRESLLHNNWVLIPLLLGFVLFMEIHYMGNSSMPPFDMMIIGFYMVGVSNHKAMDSISSLTSSMAWTYPGGLLGVVIELITYALIQHYIMQCVLTPYIYLFLRLF